MPENSISFTSKTAPAITAEITDASGKVIRRLNTSGKAGFQFVKWDLKTEAAAQKGKQSETPVLNPAKPGEYINQTSNGVDTAETKIMVK